MALGLKSKLFKVNEVAPSIFHLSFSDRRQMAKTFLRFQEHYESPEFRGKIFSLKEFKEWYRTTREGKFTYYSDWSGFNIPSTILEPFYAGKFKRLTPEEKNILATFKNHQGRFYIIASEKGHTSSLNHEVSHGRFYLNEKYRKEILSVLRQADTRPIQKWLLSIGYDESTLLDEVQAYLLNTYNSRDDDINFKPYAKLAEKLRAVETKYFSKAGAKL